jgi:low affinity Fe/Cu permease
MRSSAAQNRFVGIDHLTEDELATIRAKCELRAKAEEKQKTKKAA